MLTAAIFVPLAGALLIAMLPARRERLARPLAVGIAAVPLVLAALAWSRFSSTGGFELVERVDWIPSLGVSYAVGVDGLSLPLVAMTALLNVAAIAYPVDTLGRPRAYYALFLFLESASLGLFLSLDLFLFYVFFDVSLVGMYFLIGAWGHGDARRSALKFFLYTLTGSLVLLLAILGIYLSSDPRTFDIGRLIATQPLDGHGLRATLVFVGFLVGFGVKTPIVPFHTWLPPAHVDAPAPASTILAGVLLKMGTYGLLRIPLAMMPQTFRRFSLLVVVIGVVGIVYGALVALAQTNFKRMVAYTSVNHMGYVILGTGAAAAAGAFESRRIALTGATVEMVAHGLITGALFLISGSLWSRARSYEYEDFGGLAGRAPLLTTATGLAAFASLGLPALAGFVAEIQIFAGTFDVYPVAAGIGLVGVVLLAAMMLRMLQQVFLGPLDERRSHWTDLTTVEVVALVPVLALVVVIGVAPAWLLDVVDSAIRTIVPR